MNHSQFVGYERKRSSLLHFRKYYRASIPVDDMSRWESFRQIKPGIATFGHVADCF
jgi:hypothetical protein